MKVRNFGNVENEHGNSNANAVFSVKNRIGERTVDMTNQLWYFRVNQNLHPIM